MNDLGIFLILIIGAGLFFILALRKARAKADKQMKEFHEGMKNSVEREERSNEERLKRERGEKT